MNSSEADPPKAISIEFVIRMPNELIKMHLSSWRNFIKTNEKKKQLVSDFVFNDQQENERVITTFHLISNSEIWIQIDEPSVDWMEWMNVSARHKTLNRQTNERQGPN